MIANISALADLFRLPYFPLTPTWPLLGPLGVVPLPSKWIIEFGTPIPASQLPDPYDEMAVLEKSREIRQLIQGTVDRLLVERGSAF